MNPVNWFEIPAENLNRAKSFYETVLGFTLERQDMGPMQMLWFPHDMKAHGASGSIIKGEGYVPSAEGTMVYLHVPDIEQTLEQIEKAGGRVLQGKTDIGDYGFIAHFMDSEGNRVSLHQVPEM